MNKITKLSCKWLIALFFSFLAVGVLFSPITKADMNRLTNSLTELEIELKNKGYDFPEALMENYSYITQFPAFLVLEKEATNSWREMLVRWETIAPNNISKILTLQALFRMNQEEYISFLQKATEMAENGKMSKELFRIALEAVYSPNDRILMQNYQDNRIRIILNKAKILFADDAIMVGYFNRVLSGEAKKNHDKYLWRSGEIWKKGDIKMILKESPIARWITLFLSVVIIGISFIAWLIWRKLKH